MKNRRAPAPKDIQEFKQVKESTLAFLETANNPVIAIAGPTASGKTDFSIALAKALNGVVINADSRQFYKGMNIGTAKITREEMQGVEHFGLDFLNPDDEYSVALYQEQVEKWIAEIQQKNKIPLLVGGSGLFIDSIVKGLQIPRIPPDDELRQRLEQQSKERLLEQIKQLDPQIADEFIDSNKRRMIRALEIMQKANSPLSKLRKQEPKYQSQIICIWTDPDELTQRIDQRAEIIWQSGFLNEVKQLIKSGYTADLKSMVAHGYREAMLYLQGSMTEPEAVMKMKQNTRRYAKRQRTWWRNRPEVIWAHPLHD
jgi:tRNA dimethylallyltransferase